MRCGSSVACRPNEPELSAVGKLRRVVTHGSPWQVATAHFPLPGSYSSAEARRSKALLLALPPPATSTLPSGNVRGGVRNGMQN